MALPPEMKITYTPLSRRIMWEPKADITAHELALAMPPLLALVVIPNDPVTIERGIDMLPDGVKRHFKIG